MSDIYPAWDPLSVQPGTRDPEPIELGLVYDSTPAPREFDYSALRTRLPLWLAGAALAYFVADRLGGRL